MATRIYFLKTSGTISLSVTPTVIGIAGTVVQLKKSGGSVIELGDSGNKPTGVISKIVVGKSPDLLNGVLVVTTVVDLINVPKSQWDSVFDTLRITYELSGGADGPQTFNVDNDDKMQIIKKQFIVATKAVKFTTNEIL